MQKNMRDLNEQYDRSFKKRSEVVLAGRERARWMQVGATVGVQSYSLSQISSGARSHPG